MPTLEDDVNEGSFMEEVDYFWQVETMEVKTCSIKEPKT
jgi:hypothetical protein